MLENWQQIVGQPGYRIAQCSGLEPLSCPPLFSSTLFVPPRPALIPARFVVIRKPSPCSPPPRRQANKWGVVRFVVSASKYVSVAGSGRTSALSFPPSPPLLPSPPPRVLSRCHDTVPLPYRNVSFPPTSPPPLPFFAPSC